MVPKQLYRNTLIRNRDKIHTSGSLTTELKLLIETFNFNSHLNLPELQIRKIILCSKFQTVDSGFQLFQYKAELGYNDVILHNKVIKLVKNHDIIHCKTAFFFFRFLSRYRCKFRCMTPESRRKASIRSQTTLASTRPSRASLLNSLLSRNTTVSLHAFLVLRFAKRTLLKFGLFHILKYFAQDI